MAKDKSTVNNDNNYHNSDPIEEEMYKASEYKDEEKFPSPNKKSDMVTLVFKKNRTKELHIGREIYRFEGCVSIEVPRSVIEHPDFENQRKYFLIKGE